LIFSENVEMTRALPEAGAIVNETNNFAHEALENAPNEADRQLLIESCAK
jgi:hypothetical protein